MTAVASPPSFQSLPRLGWNSSSNGQGGLNPMSADDVSRMFMPRKSVQRTNSSSSIASSSSSTTTVSASPQQPNGASTTNNESSTWATRKKAAKGVWSSSKADPVAGVSDARPQPVSAPSTGPTASATMSAIHQPSPTVGSQRMVQSQQNGTRGAVNGQNSNESPAVLTLLPMNATFERKQINVPFFPEILRIGRQTNAKTVPTPYNGYFDSKVLSRQHAEIWAERTGKILIRDVKSSNGTFVNGQRLSPENRDSEPHELREGDMLELGIDIVSEDQKTIVHHKVSAKVEHAGMYGAITNVLDLNFGDLDPTSGGGLLPSALGQPMSHLRGRPGSAASMRSNGQMSGPQSVAGSHVSAMSQQRQMNFWLSSVSVESIVRRLAAEMKQAKEQSQELNMTGDFLDSLLTQDPKEPLKPSPTESTGQRLVNGKHKIPKIDSNLRFSDPPAPPPQQPLPEKPDAARSSPASGSDPGSIPYLRRHDTERPLSANSNSPVNRESSGQILALVEALNSTKKELDSQGARVKALEDMLQQERTARESAEERARRLEVQSWRDSQGQKVDAVFEPPIDVEVRDVKEAVQEKSDHASDTSREWSSSNGSLDKVVDGPLSDSHVHNLQQRLDIMVTEMDEMKQQMERYRRRAETAEGDRNSLAEMIEKIRQDHTDAIAKRNVDNESEATLVDADQDADTVVSTASGTPSSRKTALANGKAIDSQMSQLERAVATALASKQHDRNDMLMQSAPYASILGVVLIGVGLMTYLNSWQKLEK